MIARNWIRSALVLALLLPGLIGCQPAASNSAIEELTKSVKKLVDQHTEQLAKLETDLGAANARLAKVESSAAVAASFEARLSRGEHKLEANIEATNENLVTLGQHAKKYDQQTEQLAKLEADAKKYDQQTERLAKLEADVKANVEVTGEQQKVLGQIAEKDGANNSILSILKLTNQNPQFRDDLSKAIEKVTPQPPPSWGTVRIENRMETSQDFEVNGVSYWVPPRSFLDVAVRAGWVTTRLTGYEGAKTWRLSPDYFQTIFIKPKPIYSYDVW
jgi:DNA repair exonuclease SbcCD ATPase subunit